MSIYRLRDADIDEAAFAGERTREPVLASVIVHLLMVIAILLAPPRQPPVVVPTGDAPRAFFAPPPPARPTPPSPRDERARISVGSQRLRDERPLVLERDVDVTSEQGKGRRVATDSNGSGQDPAEQATPEARPSPGDRGAPPVDDQPDDRFRRPSGSLLESSERSVERRSREADLGSPTGVVGQQMGALFFDPQGADFTRWINHFRREVYRNWLLPQPALLGISGRVRITFQVERDGSLSASYVSGPSGIPAFDRSSANAIRASQLLPLPADFAPARVIMDVVFIYNER